MVIKENRLLHNSSEHVALCFINYGPYHRARLQACINAGLPVFGLELASVQSEYSWQSGKHENVFSLTDKPLEIIAPGRWKHLASAALDRLNPKVCAVAGYSHVGILGVVSWCLRNNRPIIMMSDSRIEDARRWSWREWIKRRLIGLCSSSIVAGTPHFGYLVSLKMPPEQIFLGYDVVDNRHFSTKAEESRKQKAAYRKRFGLPENYFIASARFIEKKNLPRLLEAYARYRDIFGKSEIRNRKSEIWDLVLLGDGPLHKSLCALRSALGLDACVHLSGFIQYPDLPAYYGLAGGFIHASTTDQWGLVVNEAMASSLPVLVSNRCGCTQDLVQEGVNGFTFDPYDVEEIAQKMFWLSTLNAQLSTFGPASQNIIADWGTERFAEGLRRAMECALKIGSKRPGVLDRILLSALIHR